MAVLALESANRVRQKTRMMTRNPGVFYGLKALFMYLATNKGNPDLQLVTASGAANGLLVDNPCRLYAAYLKKGVVATAAFFKISDHATVVQASSELIIESSTASEEIFLIWPIGHPFATGIAAGSYTAYNGGDTTTASTATHELSGFLIIGAA